MSAEGVATSRIKAHAKACNCLKIEPLVDLESEDYYHKGSERTNTSKDDKTDKRKTSSELKRKDMQTVSHVVSHVHVVNDGKTNWLEGSMLLACYVILALSFLMS